jgi:hypothetical protein
MGLTAGRPTLLLVGGPPGAGKTTVATALGEALGWTVIRSDMVRREVVGSERWGGSPEWLATRFSPATTQATYREMLRRARRRLEHGDSSIVDATWATQPVRALAQAAALETGSRFVELHCTVELHVAESRVAARIAAGGDIATATVAIVRRIGETFVPWPSALSIDSGTRLVDTIAQALSAVSGASPLIVA